MDPNNQANGTPAPVYTQPTEPVQNFTPTPTSKKPLWIGLIGGVLLLIALVVGSIFWANGQQKKYALAADEYKKSMKSAYDGLSQNPEDTDAYIAYLDENIGAFNTVLAAKPKDTSILWVRTAGDQDKTKVKKLTDGATKFRAAMQQYRLFLAYRNGLLEAVKSTGGKISTPDDMRSARTRIEKAQQTIRSLKPPKGLEQHQKAKADGYNAPIVDIKKALSAYDSGDADGYTDAVLQLGEDVGKLKTLPQTVEEMMGMHDHYNSFSDRYDELGKLL